MWTQSFKVELLADVSITADASTTGGHTCLDYLPGSLFLGAAVAGSLNSAASGADQSPKPAFDPQRFLSGRVRFLNAYPEINGLPSYPLPLSFHSIKGQDWENQIPYNPLVDQTPSGQPKQMRTGYFNPNGEVAIQEFHSTIKTAIDRTKGRARDAQLFDRQSIPAGSTFAFTVQADDEADLDFISNLLTKGLLRLGKSRSAEYGQAVATPLEREANSPKPPESVNGEIHFYLSSDLALQRDGAPVLHPIASDFGLPVGCTPVLSKWFLRTRSYAPWNAFFQCRMSERQVLCKGSVLTFAVATDAHFDTVSVQNYLAPGIGMYREEGLGQVLLDPEWLRKAPELKRATSLPRTAQPSKPQTPLVSYLSAKSADKEAELLAYQNGIEWAQNFFSLSEKLRRDKRPTPGKSQWANIREIATRCIERPNDLLSEMEAFCTQGLRRKHWVESQTPDQRNLYNAIIEKLGQMPDRTTCHTLCHAAMAIVKKHQHSV